METNEQRYQDIQEMFNNEVEEKIEPDYLLQDFIDYLDELIEDYCIQMTYDLENKFTVILFGVTPYILELLDGYFMEACQEPAVECLEKLRTETYKFQV